MMNHSSGDYSLMRWHRTETRTETGHFKQAGIRRQFIHRFSPQPVAWMQRVRINLGRRLGRKEGRV